MCRYRISSLAAVMFFIAASAFGQATSSLRVHVVDASSLAMPGVTLELANNQSGFKRMAVSDETGTSQFAQVPPGLYEVVAELQGFKTSTVKVTLQVDTPASLNVKMDVAGVSETVTVQAETVVLNTVDATVGNAFGETQVRQLPLVTRNVVELLSLQPGVTPTGEVVGARRDQNNITLDGVDVNDNQTAGLESSTGANSQPGFNFNPTGGFREAGFNAALPIPLDSVQEFRVTVTGENANQGRSSGGQVSLVTKSGTNQFRGSAYEYNRDNSTSANNWFSNRAGIPVQKLVRNQYGASLGGPVVNNRFFFFANVEQRTDDSQQSVLRKVPSATMRQGTILAKASDGTTYQLGPDAIKAIDPLHIGNSPLLADVLNGLPQANDPASGLDGGANFAGYRFNAPQTLHNTAYVVKTDVKLDANSNHNLSFRATIADNSQDDILAQYAGSAPTGVLQNNSFGLSASLTSVLRSNLVNAATFGVTRIGQKRSGPTTIGLTLDTIDVGTDYSTGSRPFSRGAPTYNYTDDLTWTKGRHTVTTGANVRFVRNERTSFTNAFPSYSYSRGSLIGLGSDIALATQNYLIGLTGNPAIRLTDATSVERAFGDLLGLVSSGTMTNAYTINGTPLPIGAPTIRRFADNEYEAYVSDNWRLSPNLTLNYGLRYMYLGVPWEQGGLEVAPTFPLQDFFDERKAGMLAGIPSSQLPHNIQTYNLVGPGTGQGWYGKDLNNFAPRLAMAYTPTEGFLHKLLGDGGVVRVGASKTYDRFGSDLVTKFDTNASFGLSDIIRLGPSYNFTTSPRYTGTLPDLPAAPQHTFPFTPPIVDYVGGAYMGIASDLHAPYSLNLNLSVAREIRGGMTLEVGYMARAGRDLLMQVDATGGWGIYFTDPASGMSWHTMSSEMRDYHNAGIDPASVRKNPGLIPNNPFVENMYPALKNLYFPGSASANYYDLLYNQNGGSDSDATNVVDRLKSTQFPNCIVKTGCNTLFASQSSGLSMWTNAGYSNYQGGTLSLRKHFRQGVAFDFNYTLSHSRDNGIAPESGGGIGGGIMLNAYNYDAFYGDSDWDIRHNINSNVLFDLPFGQGKKFMSGATGVLNQVVGGWQLSSIFRYHSALPTAVAYSGIWVTNWSFTGQADPVGAYNAQVQTNNLGNPSIFPTTASSAANWTSMRPGDAGTRAAVRLDDYYNTDIAITKSFRMPIADQRLQFRAEAFNAFNNVNYTNIALDANSPNSFGQFTAAAPARVFQFALRYEF